jgi:hypothetical protein
MFSSHADLSISKASALHPLQVANLLAQDLTDLLHLILSSCCIDPMGSTFEHDQSEHMLHSLLGMWKHTPPAAAADVTTEAALQVLRHAVLKVPGSAFVEGLCKSLPATQQIAAADFLNLAHETLQAEMEYVGGFEWLCCVLPAAQQLDATAVEGLFDAAITQMQPHAVCVMCDHLPGAKLLQAPVVGSLLLEAGRRGLWTAVAGLSTLPAAKNVAPAAVLSLLSWAAESTNGGAPGIVCAFPQVGSCGAKDAEQHIFTAVQLGLGRTAASICRHLPAAAQLNAAAVAKLLEGAVERRDAVAVAAFCDLPAAAELDPSKVQALWGSTRATWGVWGNTDIAKNRGDWIDWAYEPGVKDLQELAEEQQEMDEEAAHWAAITGNQQEGSAEVAASDSDEEDVEEGW